MTLKDVSELVEQCKRDEEYQASLTPDHPDHDEGFQHYRDENSIELYWLPHRHLYALDLRVIRTPLDLAHWIAHIGKKQWPYMTPRRIVYLIEEVCHIKAWNLWQPHLGVMERGTTADQERAKLTSRLRWRVLERDGHRCRSCGMGPEHGAVLHMDHITPISKGGITSFANLQTLCVSCNAGKASRA